MNAARLVLALSLLTALGACAQIKRLVQPSQSPPPVALPDVAIPDAPEEVAAVVSEAGQAEALPANRRTAEDFDTTTAEERAVAVAAAEQAPADAERLLGRDIASLGDATEPGLWVKTPLVSAVSQGRVAWPDKGTTVLVELRPGSTGTQISLAALRLLEASLTDLPTVEIYAR